MEKIELIEQTINKIDDLIKEQLPESKYQFELYDLATNTKHFRGLDEPFHWGSIYKFFVVAEVYKMSERNELKLSDTISLNKTKYTKGVGFIRFLENLDSISFSDCCKILISTSDNVCADTLTDLVSIDRLNALFKSNNCKNSLLSDNLHQIVSLLINNEHDYYNTSYIHSKQFYNTFEISLSKSLNRNYTTVNDLNNMFHCILSSYLINPEKFISLVNVPNVHSRFSQYMGFHKGISFIGKTGTLGFGIISNEAAIIYDTQNQKTLGYFSILTKNNRKRKYQSFDTLALIAIEIGKLYEQMDKQTK
ncbi:MAG TPA: serine hydrolase [Chitinophagales bacterium]|nr:serine hydrolase [Chitinophagales bacterium]